MNLHEQLAKLRAAKGAAGANRQGAIRCHHQGPHPNDEQEKAIKALEDRVTQLEVSEARLQRLIDAAKAADTATPITGQTEAEGAGKACTERHRRTATGKRRRLCLIVKATAVAGLNKGATTAGDVLRAWGARSMCKKHWCKKPPSAPPPTARLPPAGGLNTLTGSLSSCCEKDRCGPPAAALGALQRQDAQPDRRWRRAVGR